MNTAVGIAVLAGGKSIRMGSPKAEIVMPDGHILLERICDEMGDFPFRYISVSELNHYDYDGYISIDDEYKEIGPLGAIVSVLKGMDQSCDAILLAAVDMTRFDNETAHFIADSYGGEDVLLVKSKRGNEPLASVYARGCIPVIEEQIGACDYKIGNIFDKLNVRILEIDDDGCFTNVNTPEDLERVIWNESRM